MKVVVYSKDGLQIAPETDFEEQFLHDEFSEAIKNNDIKLDFGATELFGSRLGVRILKRRR